MLQNLYTIISLPHIISLQICALICTEGCLSGYISFFSKEILIVWFISIFIEKYNFLFSFNCQFQGMNWQLCSPIFLAALLESLLNKLSEILKLCHLRCNINQDLNPEMFDVFLWLFVCFFCSGVGKWIAFKSILKQFCLSCSLPRSSKFYCVWLKYNVLQSHLVNCAIYVLYN